MKAILRIDAKQIHTYFPQFRVSDDRSKQMTATATTTTTVPWIPVNVSDCYVSFIAVAFFNFGCVLLALLFGVGSF